MSNYMNFEDVKNSVNEWVWDQFEGTYFRILGVDEETKYIKASGLSGRKTEFLFWKNRFSKEAQKPVFSF